MGLAIILPGEDFSAQATRRLWPQTSLTSGLDALFETRRDASLAIKNRATGGVGTVVGTPSYSATHIGTDRASGIDTGISPTGTNTTCVVMKIRPGVITQSFPLSSIGTSITTQGGHFFSLTSTQVTFEAAKWNGAVYDGTTFSLLVKPTQARWEMYFGVCENNVSARLYHPKSDTISTSATVGRTFAHASPQTLRTGRFSTLTASDDDDVAMVAHWTSALTAAQMATFYKEQQAYLSRVGINI